MLYQKLAYSGTSGYRINLVKSKDYKKENVLPFMAFVQRSVDQQQRDLCFKMDRLNALQDLDSIRDELLDILETSDILALFWPMETCSVHCKPSLL